MKDIAKLNREKSEKVKELRGLVAVAETRDDKSHTSEEQTKIDSLIVECEKRQKEIDQEISIQALEKKSTAERTANDPKEIKSFGEFLRCVRFDNHNLETRDLTMKDGPGMGYVVPDQFDSALRMVDLPGAIIRPRATIIPAGSSPDAKYSFNSLDQSGTKGVYGGIAVTWVDENAEISDAGDPQVKQITLEPKQVSGYIDVSDKLIDNAASVGALVQSLLSGAIMSAQEDAFYANGNGVGKPLGVIGCGAEIVRNRATALQISYADVVNMYSQFKMGGSPVFIASQSTIPQLTTLADANGNAMWQPSVREGVPATLMGVPVMFSDLAPALGTKGDLALMDFKYYYIKEGSGLSIMMNPYENMGKRLTRIYAYWNVDGQPMLTSPLLLRDGVSTVSPFVTLGDAV